MRGLASAPAFAKATTLTLTTAASTPAGTYTLRVEVQRPRRSGNTEIQLVVSGSAGSEAQPVTAPPDPPNPPNSPDPPLKAPEAFTITGTLSNPLRPGSGEPLDLTLTNLESTDLSISELEIEVADVQAPHADLIHACGTGDFAVDQFSGAPGFTLAASSSASLSELGFAPSEWPQVSMLNPPVNQDGCKGASLTLSFAGTATEGTP